MAQKKKQHAVKVLYEITDDSVVGYGLEIPKELIEEHDIVFGLLLAATIEHAMQFCDSPDNKIKEITDKLTTTLPIMHKALKDAPAKDEIPDDVLQAMIQELNQKKAP